MARQQRWRPGAVIRKTLADGHAYYGRLLEFSWVAFYDLRTTEPLDDPAVVTANRVLFTLTAHQDLIRQDGWEIIGVVPVADSWQLPVARFRQDIMDPRNCQIVDANGDTRPATIEECEGLEREAVWEPEHIEDRLVDHFAGRPNVWVESMKLVHPKGSA